MKSKEFEIHYAKLERIRDKYIAHLDKDIAEIRIDNQDIEYFLKLTHRILKEVIDPITTGGSSIYFGHPSTIKNFIRKMAECKSVYDKLENGIMNPIERKKLKPETEIDLLRILGKRNFIVEGIG